MNKLKQLVEQIFETLFETLYWIGSCTLCFISIVLFVCVFLPIILPFLLLFVALVVLLLPILLISIPFISWNTIFNKSTDNQEIMCNSEHNN